jgi:hypothetical protein
MTTATVTDYVVRLRHDRGHINLVTSGASPRGVVETVLGAEGAPVRAVLWVKVRPVCEYCTERAWRYVRDSGDGTPLCDAHALDHYGSKRGVRDHTGTLGPSRFVEVPEDEWKDGPG